MDLLGVQCGWGRLVISPTRPPCPWIPKNSIFLGRVLTTGANAVLRGMGFFRVHSGWWGQVLSPSRPPCPCTLGNSIAQQGVLASLLGASTLTRLLLIATDTFLTLSSGRRLIDGAMRVASSMFVRFVSGSSLAQVLAGAARLWQGPFRRSDDIVLLLLLLELGLM